MDKSELDKLVNEYEDKNSSADSIEFLKDKLFEKLREFPVKKDSQQHRLNLVIREIEKELDWVETEKLAEYDPEHR